MKRADFRAAIANMLDADPADVRDDSLLAEMENWDSLAVLSFVAFADSEMGMTLGSEDLAGCRTVDDLATLFRGKVEA
jgi:acyl carrier protein